MEIDSESFDLLFEDPGHDNLNGNLSLVLKCISESSKESEVLRALEIAHLVCVKSFSIDEIENGLFHIICPAAQNFIERKVKSLEENPTKCIQWFDPCLQIVSQYGKIFEHLKQFPNISMIKVKSLLIASCEVLFCCFSHCKISQKVYGDLFYNLSNYLSNVFKKCCDLLDHLLSFLSSVECDIETETSLLHNILSFLSKSGFLLMDLDAKTMAKVWKTYIVLVERNLSCLNESPNVSETIENLSSIVTTTIDTINSDRDLKLACFLLKLIIRLIEVGCSKNYHKGILNLLLRLCKCDLFETNQGHEGLINQLTIGTEPLLSQLMSNEEFVQEFCQVSEEEKKLPEFSILCCLVLKKLVQGQSSMRSLWFNQKENILKWIFIAISSSDLMFSKIVNLPTITINGKLTKFTDTYEYIFVSTSSFLMTSTAEEYCLVEEILFENIMQENPMKALFAVDTWCLLARFADSELCFSQMITLGKILLEFKGSRVEKWYLTSLIRRLFPLLVESHRKAFLKFFQSSFYSSVWERFSSDCFTPDEIREIRRPIVDELHQIFDQSGVESINFEPELPKRIYTKSEISTDKLWKFNCKALSPSSESWRFLKIISNLTAAGIGDLPSKDLLLVLTQMKKTLSLEQPTCIKLYFLWILKSLSTIRIPPGNCQKNIFSSIGELFRDFLSSKEIIVKIRAFEVFYFFSHITSHGEIIGLTVLKAPELKLEITNYFKKIIPNATAEFSLIAYVQEVCRCKINHVCYEILEGGSPLLPQSFGPVVHRWKTDGKLIMKYFTFLSETEKNEIRDLCNAISSQ